MSEVAKAYIQLVPSASGIKGAITTELGGEAESAGISAGGRIAGAIKSAIVAAGIGTAIKDALNEGAALQQSIGGVETLFKDSADVVRRYADEAYKSAGLSANAYMEQVTSFSASLLQSLGGDTAKAAESANQAVIDMADNANKMGTDIASIQNAYQGFAKQNYTMLDNLKLGYGGTKQEMERLLADAEKLSGVKYDIGSLDDVYSAIHVVQEELGITGTTAKEASETFSGSFASMKAAAQNFLGALTTGEGVENALGGLIDSAKTFLIDNLAPMAGTLVDALLASLPAIAEAGVELVIALAQGIADHIDELIPAVTAAVLGIVEALTEPETLEKLVEAAIQLTLAIAKGLIEALPDLLLAAGTLLLNLTEAIGNWMGDVYQQGKELVSSIGKGIADAAREALSWGRDLIDNFVQGIRERIQQVIDTVKEIAGNIKDYLGFSEPELGPLANFHTFAPDMMELFAQGIRANAGLVTDAIDSSFDVGARIVDYGIAGTPAPLLAQTAESGGAPTGAEDIVINLTATLDGQVISRNQYRYNRDEAARRGSRAVR